MDETESLIETVSINASENILDATADEVQEHSNEGRQSEPEEQPTLPRTRWRIAGLVYCS